MANENGELPTYFLCVQHVCAQGVLELLIARKLPTYTRVLRHLVKFVNEMINNLPEELERTKDLNSIMYQNTLQKVACCKRIWKFLETMTGSEGSSGQPSVPHIELISGVIEAIIVLAEEENKDPQSEEEWCDNSYVEPGESFTCDTSAFACVPFDDIPEVPGFDEDWKLLQCVLLPDIPRQAGGEYPFGVRMRH